MYMYLRFYSIKYLILKICIINYQLNNNHEFLGLAGHCFRHKELLAGELVLWEPTHGRRGRGRPSATFIDTLKRDLGTDDKLELEVCMTNQEDWRARRAARLRPP